MSAAWRRWPWGRIVLVASLALNLLVVGAVAGAFWRHGGERSHGARGFAVPYVRALPGPERRALFAELRRGGQGDHGARRQAAYGAVLAALRAEPFDPEAVASALARQRADAADFQSRAEAGWLARVTAMDAQERARYADRVEAHLQHGKRRRRD